MEKFAGQRNVAPGVNPDKNADAIQKACDFISRGKISEAAARIRSDYPFTPVVRCIRSLPLPEVVRVFIRDGFIDRYSGQRLIFPPVLRIISQALPEDFPYDPHWEMGSTHMAFWQLSATIDHVLPVCRGGTDEPANLVTTSILKNSAKASWTLSELGWAIHPTGSVSKWDGLLGWFLDYAAKGPGISQSPYFARWIKAASKVWRQSRAENL